MKIFVTRYYDSEGNKVRHEDITKKDRTKFVKECETKGLQIVEILEQDI